MTTVLSARSLLAGAGDALLVERRPLELDELAALAELPPESTPSLAALAHEVRLAWCGPEVEVEGILSAKTGGCPEDCHFCSQSSKFDTPVKATPFLDADEILAAAEETKALGASEFCIVLAVRGPNPDRDGPARAHRAAGARAHGTERGRLRGHPHPRSGRATRGRGGASVQPQPRDRTFVLR